MKNLRRVGVAIAAAVVSFGLLGLSAPAHAKPASKDISWGWDAVVVTSGPVAVATPTTTTTPAKAGGPVKLK